MAAACVGGVGAFYRFGESGELVAGASERSRKRNGNADGCRSKPGEAYSAVAGGEFAAGGDRRGSRRDAGAESEPRAGGFAEYEKRSAICRVRDRLASARVYYGTRLIDLRDFRV